MKFRVDRDQISEAVVWVGRVIPSRSPQPILCGIQIVATNNELTLSGSDLDVRNREIVPADVIEPGEIIISGRLLADIVRALPSAPVEFEVNGNRVEITCGRSVFSLQIMATGDYPTPLEIPDATGTISATDFTTAISQVGLAAAKNDFRHHLTGINFEIDGPHIEIAATDGNRLAVKKLTWSPSNPKVSTSALVPARYLTDIAKTLNSSEAVTLGLPQSSNEGIIGITAEPRQTTSRTIASNFPAYKSLLEFEPTSIVQINTAALIESIKRVSLVLEHNSPVGLRFENGEACIFGAGGAGERSEAKEFLESSLSGEDITIGFYPHYLIEGLTALNAPVTEIQLTAPMKPALFFGKDEVDGQNDESFQYLLLPRRMD